MPNLFATKTSSFFFNITVGLHAINKFPHLIHYGLCTFLFVAGGSHRCVNRSKSWRQLEEDGPPQFFLNRPEYVLGRDSRVFNNKSLCKILAGALDDHIWVNQNSTTAQ